jgi:hypothetical protein
MAAHDRGTGVQLSGGTASKTALGPLESHIQWVPGAVPPWIKRSEHEVDHSSPSTAEVKNVWGMSELPHTSSLTWCLDKNMKNFTNPEQGPVPSSCQHGSDYSGSIKRQIS